MASNWHQTKILFKKNMDIYIRSKSYIYELIFPFAVLIINIIACKKKEREKIRHLNIE
jgi:hypothetical protein